MRQRMRKYIQIYRHESINVYFKNSDNLKFAVFDYLQMKIKQEILNTLSKALIALSIKILIYCG